MEHQLYEFLKAYYEAGIDAVIVQDFGVFSFIRSFFPDLPIHASTQMSVCQAYGARFCFVPGHNGLWQQENCLWKKLHKCIGNAGVKLRPLYMGHFACVIPDNA